MLKIFGKLTNRGNLKIYNISSYYNYLNFPFFQDQFGAINYCSNAVTSKVAGSLSTLYISAPGNGYLNYFSGSAILRSWIKLNSDGSVDSSATASLSIGGSAALSFSLQTDGKVVVASSEYPSLQLFNTDNTVDSNYKVKSGASDNSGYVYATDIQNDNKIIAAGNSTIYSGSQVNKIFRVNSSGSIDSTFNPGDGFNSQSVAVGNNYVPLNVQIVRGNKIMVVGSFTEYYQKGGGGIYTNSGSVRINSDGTIDTTFKNGGGFSGSSINPSWTCYTADENLATGKIVMGGSFSAYSGSRVSQLVRTDASGAIDSSFNTGSGFSNFAVVYKVVHSNLLSTSNIYVGGSFTSYSGSNISGIMRLNNSGAIDTTFKTGGGVSGSSATVYNIKADGVGVYIIGDFTDYSGSTNSKYAGGIVRVKSDGSVDETYNPAFFYSSYSDSGTVNQGMIKKDSSGRYIVVGNFEAINNSQAKRNTYSGIFRYDSNFNFDPTFNAGVGVLTPKFAQSAFDFQSDGKIVLVGAFSYYSGSLYFPIRTNGLVRINTDGTKDLNYKTGSGFINPSTIGTQTPYAIAIQPDDKAVAVGNFNMYSGSRTSNIVRINTDGTKDTTFITGSGLNSIGYEVKMQSVGGQTKILVGGNFTAYSGSTANNIVRINSDGTLDTTFNIGTGFNSGVRTILSQSDGKIMVGGLFSTLNGSSVPKGLVRLNSDGTLDTSFNSGGSGFSSTSSYPIRILQKSDSGYIVLIHRDSSFGNTYNGVNITGATILGLGNDGTYSFQTVTGAEVAYDNASDIVELQDTNLVVVGNFTQISGSYQCNIAKIAPNGRTSYIDPASI